MQRLVPLNCIGTFAIVGTSSGGVCVAGRVAWGAFDGNMQRWE